jgi:hypothetical protein
MSSHLNKATLREDFDQIVEAMPYRNPIGAVNNFVTPFSEMFGVPQFVCGDQAAYMAAALEMRGYDALVIKGNGPATHAWVEVKMPDGSLIEVDPWNNQFESKNRA